MMNTSFRAEAYGKTALGTGIAILLREQQARNVDCIFLARAFGSHLDPADILNIGMVPQVPVACVRTIGNAAGDGARMALFKPEFERARPGCGRRWAKSRDGAKAYC